MSVTTVSKYVETRDHADAPAGRPCRHGGIVATRWEDELRANMAGQGGAREVEAGHGVTEFLTAIRHAIVSGHLHIVVHRGPPSIGLA